MGDGIRFVGLDVHKRQTVVALADSGREGEVRHYGAVETDRSSIEKLARKLARGGKPLRFCYEAGPCGYGIQRWLTGLGHDCEVVAPSLIPCRPGERVRTDRRDAIKLARLHRAGELTAVWVPEPAHEAMRDLVRARAVAVYAVRRARQQLSGFLLRHDRIYSRKAWTGAHRRWLAELKFEHAAQRIVLEDYINAVGAAEQRRDGLTEQIRELLPSWSLAPIVEAVQALRGVAAIVAIIIVAELGDPRRFDSPRQLMAYLGLVPSEASSGEKVYRGGITKAGNRTARRALIEAAWTYRFPARRSKHLLARCETVPPAIQAIAWKAQLRLSARYRKLVARGKLPTVAVTAVARELVGFIWAIARELPAIPARA
ncbi:Transposase [Rhizobiales bacterium GAS191]|nr:Transposase [Rhizobiales bacterium GAS191]